MNLDDIRTLYAYNRWASERTFTAVEKLSNEQFTAKLVSSFPSVREALFHILGAEWVWLRRWQGKSPRATRPNPNVSFAAWSALAGDEIPSVEELSTLASLREFSETIDRERQEFLLGLDEERLQAPLSFRDMAGTPYSEPLVHMLQHVVNHGTYHRGQIVTMLRQLGAEAVSLDMIYFFRERTALKS